MPSSSVDLSGKIVLVVEDSLTSKIYFEAALKKIQVGSLWAKNGIEAVNLFNENRHINLVLMDLNLPHMNGFEATEQIRKMDPSVPIIVQSAFVLSGEEERSYKAGCNLFLAKPVRMSVLIEEITRLIR